MSSCTSAGRKGLAGSDAPLAVADGRVSGGSQELILRESHVITLDEPFDSDRHQVSLGLYRASGDERLPVMMGRWAEIRHDLDNRW